MRIHDAVTSRFKKRTVDLIYVAWINFVYLFLSKNPGDAKEWRLHLKGQQ